MQTILVTGSGGQLGQELRIAAATPPFSPAPSFRFIFTDRSNLSIEDAEAVRKLFREEKPTWCINCAAYTAVDKAETEKDAAFRINADAVANLASACNQTGARLIHISTDYVFDGHSAVPLKEKDPTSPINVYGASKLKGEQEAFAIHPSGTMVIRTSWVYSEFGHNFVKTMMRLMKDRPAIHVVNDQIGSPTYAADLARAIGRIVSGDHFVPGIYNYSNLGEISWYEFALAIRELTGSNCQVQPIPSSQFPTPARRPNYSLLDKTLIQETYKLTIPLWRESLQVCLEKLQAPGPRPHAGLT